jgi:transposase-like protein
MKDALEGYSIGSSEDICAVVAAYRQSGRSLKEFARERGIKAGRLHYWVYGKNQDLKAKSLTRGRSSSPEALFQEVRLQTGSGFLQSWAVEVSLAGGLNVRFSGAAHPEWIGAVVQSLQGPC